MEVELQTTVFASMILLGSLGFTICIIIGRKYGKINKINVCLLLVFGSKSWGDSMLCQLIKKHRWKNYHTVSFQRKIVDARARCSAAAGSRERKQFYNNWGAKIATNSALIKMSPNAIKFFISFLHGSSKARSHLIFLLKNSDSD